MHVPGISSNPLLKEEKKINNISRVSLPMLRYGLHGSVKASISDGVKIAPLRRNFGTHQQNNDQEHWLGFCLRTLSFSSHLACF
jgi:hypothetical protein